MDHSESQEERDIYGKCERGAWIPIEQLWSVFGHFILGSYGLPGRRRAYLPASSIGFCRTINIYLWRYLFYL